MNENAALAAEVQTVLILTMVFLFTSYAPIWVMVAVKTMTVGLYG